MDQNSLKAIARALRDSLLLALLRTALALVQLTVDLLALDRAGREEVLARLQAMLFAGPRAGG